MLGSQQKLDKMLDFQRKLDKMLGRSLGFLEQAELEIASRKRNKPESKRGGP